MSQQAERVCLDVNCLHYLSSVAGCTTVPCGTGLSVCPVCEYHLVEKFTHVCDQCAGTVCAECGKIDGELIPLTSKGHKDKKLFCSKCFDSICKDAAQFDSYTETMERPKIPFSVQPPKRAHPCFGCGDSIDTSRLFCSICDTSVRQGRCVECNIHTKYVTDETGRCALCSITSEQSYPTNAADEPYASTSPMCACNLEIATYEGAVCKKCEHTYWDEDQANVYDASDVGNQIIPLNRQCPSCHRVYIPEDKEFCWTCEQQFKTDNYGFKKK